MYKTKRLKIITEITEYIIANNGPDEEGRGHPVKKYLKYSELDTALTAAKERGFCRDVKPYHFRYVMNMYDNSWIADEVLVKKINQLLNGKYEGDLISFIQNTSAIEMLSPFIDTSLGRPIEVSIKGAGSSPS